MSRFVSLLASSLGLLLALGCDPADGLENQEYRSYLDRYQNDIAIAAAVAAFNQLDTKRNDFNCQSEFMASQRAAWREKAGPIQVDATSEGRAFNTCLEDFFAKSGAKHGVVEMDTLISWVMHNFLPEIQTSIETEVEVSRKRIGQAGCRGRTCDALVAIGDLAVPRAGSKTAVSWSAARALCSKAGYGSLRPWRLPSKTELLSMHESNKLASDPRRSKYWSSDRSFTDEGTLQAWVLRFDLETREKNIEPELALLDRLGFPARSKVRCVFDLSRSSTSLETDVDRVETALIDAGCPAANWHRFIRLRDGLVVTWPPQRKLGKSLEQLCEELPWCGLEWKVPTKSQSQNLDADPWFKNRGNNRCVADIELEVRTDDGLAEKM